MLSSIEKSNLKGINDNVSHARGYKKYEQK